MFADNVDLEDQRKMREKRAFWNKIELESQFQIGIEVGKEKERSISCFR